MPERCRGGDSNGQRVLVTERCRAVETMSAVCLIYGRTSAVEGDDPRETAAFKEHTNLKSVGRLIDVVERGRWKRRRLSLGSRDGPRRRSWMDRMRGEAGRRRGLHDRKRKASDSGLGKEVSRKNLDDGCAERRARIGTRTGGSW